MIVMKFGGSSLESGEAIHRVTKIVKSQLERKPVVVVSAMGKTTNQLLDLAAEAERGHSYFAWKRLKELQEYHIEETGKVIGGAALESLENSLHKQFTDLCRLIFEMSDEGREFTPALKDEIASLGERVSSEILTAALASAGVNAFHLDSRKMILTDDEYTNATPLYWETYAKIRRVIPVLAFNRTVVMEGFIGATAAGATTTLGRGGSDLTASVVGAGISAEEVQIWTGVDGMLSCDPRAFDGGYRLKCLSYDEAAAMASMLTIIVPQRDLAISAGLLHREFFTKVDHRVFAESIPGPLPERRRSTKPVPETTRQSPPQLVPARQH
jgi:aspartate kinase